MSRCSSDRRIVAHRSRGGILRADTGCGRADTITRMTRPLLLATLLLGAACDAPSIYRPRVATQIAQTDVPTGTVATDVILEVRAFDAEGRPVDDVEVSFAVDAGAGEITPAIAVTDAEGFARVVWRLDTIAGEQTARAWPSPMPEAVTTVTAHATAAAPATLVLTGIDEGVLMLHPSAQRISVAAQDRYGNPLEDPAVQWSSSDAAVATVTADAGAPGYATVATVADVASGSVRISAALQGLTASRSVTVTPAGAGWVVARTPFGHAGGLNDLGHVVGHIGSRVHIWRDGDTIDVGEFDTAVDINNRGSVLLHHGNPGTIAGGPGYLWRNGVQSSVMVGPVADLNEADAVAGSWKQHIIPTWPQAYLWLEGVRTYIANPFVPEDTMPPGLTTAIALNDHNQVLISMPDTASPELWRPWIWDSGSFTPVPPPPGCSEWSGVDLNNAGTVLINCAHAAYLWDGATFTSLAPLMNGHALNERDEVIGTGSDGVYIWRNGSAQRVLAAGLWSTLRINNAAQVLVSVTESPYGSWLLTPAAGAPH